MIPSTGVNSFCGNNWELALQVWNVWSKSSLEGNSWRLLMKCWLCSSKTGHPSAPSHIQVVTDSIDLEVVCNLNGTMVQYMKNHICMTVGNIVLVGVRLSAHITYWQKLSGWPGLRIWSKKGVEDVTHWPTSADLIP